MVVGVPFITGLKATIKGTHFRGYWAEDLIKKMPEGAPVLLEPEPSNAVDKNALRVLVYDFGNAKTFKHVGYVDRNMAAVIAKHSTPTTRLIGRYTKTDVYKNAYGRMVSDSEVEILGSTEWETKALAAEAQAFITKKKEK